MAYNTGNPIGSTDARDLYDNAVNLDTAVNGSAARWTDRLGVSRPSWAGMISYVDRGAYGVMTITGYNEIFLYEGEYYRAAAATTLPYTTTGSWSDDGVDFVPIGDANLRSELSAGTTGAINGMINVAYFGTLEEARTSSIGSGKTIVVDNVLTEAQSNILGAWPADRALRVEKGGSINPTTTFTVDSDVNMNGGVFSGTGNLIFNGAFIGSGEAFQGSGTVTFGGLTNYAHLPQNSVIGQKFTEEGSNVGLIINRDIGSYMASGHGVQDYTTFHSTAVGAAQYASFFAKPTLSGVRNYSHLRGFQSYPDVNITGTCDEMTSVSIAPTVTSGTVTTVVGVSIGNPSGAGTVTNNYGLSIGDMTKGTYNWSMYVDSLAPSYYKGFVGLGQPFGSISERLTVGVGGTSNTGEAIGIDAGSGGSAGNAMLNFRRNTVAKANIGVVAGTDVGVAGAIADDLLIRSEAKNIFITANGSTPDIKISGEGGIALFGIPEYANNAAAIAGGLPVGYLYRTAEVLKIRY